MKFSELKSECGTRIGVVYCEFAKRVVFFRQPTTEEFQAMQLVDNTDKEQLRMANEDYVLGCYLGWAPIPAKEPHGSDDFEITREDGGTRFVERERILKEEGPAIVFTSWLQCVSQLGGGAARRTRFF